MYKKSISRKEKKSLSFPNKCKRKLAVYDHSPMKRNSLDARPVFIEFSENVNKGVVAVF